VAIVQELLLANGQKGAEWSEIMLGRPAFLSIGRNLGEEKFYWRVNLAVSGSTAKLPRRAAK
jgi:hypothetical protein